jgi:flavin reductase (DIM6/NTAB) family NADH-FMN oxidoreductase RutF
MVEQVAQHQGIGEAMGRIPSGVYVVTAKEGERKVGMLASWVQQVGFEPPSISVAVHPDRELYAAIETSGCFTVNVLSNQNMNLMKNFSRYSPDQFDDVVCSETNCGITLEDTVAVMQCRVLQKITAADHHLFIAEVVDGGVMTKEYEPMVHLRKSGFNY